MQKSAAAALGLALLVGAGAVVPAHAAVSDSFAAPASVLAFDQKLNGEAITVDYVQIPAAGYVAVYKTDGKAMPIGEPIGHTRVETGDHRQVLIKLSKTLKSGEKLWVTLYKDVNDTLTFEPKSGDKPVWSKDGLPPEGLILIQ